MASRFEEFWQRGGFVVIGHSERAPFPKLTFNALRAKGKKVYAVDPSRDSIEGETAYTDLASVPGLPLRAGDQASPECCGGPLDEDLKAGTAGGGVEEHCGCGGTPGGCADGVAGCGDAAPSAPGVERPRAAAAVLEVPSDETFDWIERIADAGIKDVWIHMGRDTPEALEKARELGLNVCHGTCAVQYLESSFPHTIHAWIRKALGRY